MRLTGREYEIREGLREAWAWNSPIGTGPMVGEGAVSGKRDVTRHRSQIVYREITEN